MLVSRDEKCERQLITCTTYRCSLHCIMLRRIHYFVLVVCGYGVKVQEAALTSPLRVPISQNDLPACERNNSHITVARGTRSHC